MVHQVLGQNKRKKIKKIFVNYLLLKKFSKC